MQWRRNVNAGPVLAATVALVVVGALTPPATSRAARVSVVSWSAPRTIYPLSEYAFSPVLAVDASGRAVAAWFGGTPPRVSAGGGAARVAATSGVTIVAVLGSARGGFGTPLVIGGNGIDVEGDIQAATSGRGEAYVAWESGSGAEIATAAGDRFGAPRGLALPDDGQLLQLVSGLSGPVFAVWYGYHVRSAPALEYAPLTAAGTLGRTITVAHLGSPSSNIEFAVNDHGAVAASWVNGEQGLDPSHPNAFPRVRAELCSPRGRCVAPQTLSLGPRAHQYENTATTISDDGTATVVAGGQTEKLIDGVPWEIGPHGLWGAVSRHGARFQPTGEISSTGDHPVAVARGRSGATTMFNVGLPPIDTFADATIGSSGSHFMAPTVVPDHETINAPALASDLAGTTVAAWLDSPRGVTNAGDSVHAAIGRSGSLGAPETVAAAASSTVGGLLTSGIDGRGNAIVLWEGVGAGGFSHGIFAAFRHV